MSPKIFHEAGEALYGPRWQSDLARDLEMSDRHIRRLASGAAELSPGMREDLLRICEQRAARLADVIRHMSGGATEPTARIVFEADWKPSSLDIEDGGMAKIYHMESADDPGSGMFVRVQSWDEAKEHEMFSRFAGKRIRVTVEAFD